MKFIKNHSSLNRNLTLLILLFLSTFSLHASFRGRVFIDNNQNKLADSGEKGIARVAVSDGLNVVLTNHTGEFELPGTSKTRFVFITVPAGYKTSGKHYLSVDNKNSSYDFGLCSFDTSSKKQTRFLQITDTETSEDKGWIKPISDYAKNEKASFIIHTGDICYENGLNFHGEKVTSQTMGVPVFYCIGNHDLVKGDYGEQLFEKNFGPVYYSFDAGNTHYLVTPMLGGDYKPSYTKADVYRWMKNDLKFVDKTKNIVVFNHDLLTFDDQFNYGISDKEQINLNNHNLKAWIYGHWHINYMRKHGNTGIVSVCASPPDKGGIDHSSSNFIVYEMDQNGMKNIHPRYNYLDKHLTVNYKEEPGVAGKNKNQLQVSASFYSTVSTTKKLICRIENGLTKSPWFSMKEQTDWNWAASIPLKENEFKSENAILRVCAFTNNNDSVSLLKSITNHTENNPILKMEWMRNTGANIWMCSPVYAQGKVIVATMDEFSHQKNAILAYESQSGKLLWKYLTESSIKNTICIENGNVLATDEEGLAYCLDVESGRLKWKKELGRQGLPSYISGNVSDKGVFYTGFGNYLSALSVSDGKLIWKNNDWNGGEGTTSTHSLAGKTLIAGANWRSLFGHDLLTGEKKWEVSEGGIRFRSGTSVYLDDTLFVAAEKAIVKMNPVNGHIYKSYPVNYSLQVASTPLITDKMIVVGTATDGMVAFDRNTMTELWKTKTGSSLIYTSPYSKPFAATVEASPVWVGKLIVFGASDGFLYVVNPTNGTVVQKIELGSPILGSACVIDKSVFVADFSGNIYKFLID